MLVKVLPSREEIIDALECTPEEFDALPDEYKGRLMLDVAETSPWIEI